MAANLACTVAALFVMAEPAGPGGTSRQPRFTEWQFQQFRQRYWCLYQYRNRQGREASQYVLYYPRGKNGNYYYFQSPDGNRWACCIRPGAAGYNPRMLKWYLKDRRGGWTAQPAGQCPSPPDGGGPIGKLSFFDEDKQPLPVSPPPDRFAVLPPGQQALAREFHKLLADVTISDANITRLDFGGNQAVSNDTLSQIGRIQSLEHLYVDGANIDSTGLKHLRGLANLTHLDLSLTGVSDAGLNELEPLAGLKTLIIRGASRVSPAGVRGLKKKRPKLLVTGP